MKNLMIEVGIYLVAAAAVGFMTAWLASRARWRRREAELASRWWESWNATNDLAPPPVPERVEPIVTNEPPSPAEVLAAPVPDPEPCAEVAGTGGAPEPTEETVSERALATATLALPHAAEPTDGSAPPSRRARIAAVLKTPEYSYPLELVVEGTRHQGQLHALGLRSTLDLLRKCPGAAATRSVSASTGIDSKALGRWASLADLMRMENVRSPEARLLLEVGIDSSQALAAEDAGRVAARMAGHRSDTGERTPSVATVASWIVNARALPPRLLD